MTDVERMIWTAAYAAESVKGTGFSGCDIAADDAVQSYRLSRRDLRATLEETPSNLDEAHAILVRLWSKAVGTPGYEKIEWIKLQNLLGPRL